MQTNQGLKIKFKDKYGDTRVIRGTRKGLQLQKRDYTLSLYLMPIIGKLVGQKVRAARLRAGLTMEELCIKSGLVCASHPKTRMYEIEKNTRPHGVKLGTLYAIATALDVEIGELLPSREDVYGCANVDEKKVSPFTRFPAQSRSSVINKRITHKGREITEVVAA